MNLPPTGSCSVSCPGGYYPAGSPTWQCLPCWQGNGPTYYSCATCSGGLETDCNSCNSGYFLYPNTGGHCLKSCPSGFWSDSLTRKCMPCYSSLAGPYYSCTTCWEGANDNCNSCNSGTFLHPNTGGQCLELCPDGFWGDSATNKCMSCYSSTIGPYYSCATCPAGGDYNNCGSCSSGLFLYSSQCLSACPKGYWADNSTNICQLCTANTVYISTCKLDYETIPVLQGFATSGSIAAAVFSAAFGGSGAGVNLFLYLAAIESIANQQHLNIMHSQIALNSYDGLRSTLVPNWLPNHNTIESHRLVFNYGVFEKNRRSPLYLDNFGGYLTEFLIYFGIFLVWMSISLVIKSADKLLSSPVGKGYAIALGILLSTVFGHIQRQILFSTLQIFKTDLLVDTYSRVSYSMAWITICAVTCLLFFCFCKLSAIFTVKEVQRTPITTTSQMNANDLTITSSSKWNVTKYGMLFRSFKDNRKKTFFFSFWTLLFSIIYIGLILVLQLVPILQCLSIIALTMAFLLFTGLLKPFKEKTASILFFFNFSCVLFIAILNLSIAIGEAMDDQFKNISING